MILRVKVMQRKESNRMYQSEKDTTTKVEELLLHQIGGEIKIEVLTSQKNHLKTEKH